MTPAHAALLNHASVIGATCCHPMSGRYCAVGRELWLQYRAECVRDGGKEAMLCVRAQSPEWADEIKIRALTLIDNGVENEKTEDVMGASRVGAHREAD